MDHLEEASRALKLAAEFMDRQEPSETDWWLRAAMAHALIAIAERLPAPKDWHCCNCGHEWTEAATQNPVCPMCGRDDSNVAGMCLTCGHNRFCEHKGV